MTERVSAHGPGELWTFDSVRDPHLKVPSVDELSDAWQEHHGESRLIELDATMLGVCEQPAEKPSAIIALDLCEVVRQTGLSLTRIYTDDDTSFLHDYGAYYGESVLGNNSQFSRESLLPELMHMDFIRPVPFSDAIAAFMQRWREKGVYILANTSTLPGCEISTVRFLAREYPKTTQGILFPRNHDGNGQLTKASILQHVKDRITTRSHYSMESVPTIAIEDAHHHAKDYTEASNNTHVIMPAYSWNEPLDGVANITRVEQQFGTLDTFIAADNYLTERGIL